MNNMILLEDEMLEQVWGGTNTADTAMIIFDYKPATECSKNEKGHNEDIFRRE